VIQSLFDGIGRPTAPERKLGACDTAAAAVSLLDPCHPHLQPEYQADGDRLERVATEKYDMECHHQDNGSWKLPNTDLVEFRNN